MEIKGGGMDVQAAVTREVQHRLRQNQSVGSDDHHVCVKAAELFLRFGRFQGLWLKHGNARLNRHLFDRAGCQFAATASGPVGLGVNANHLMMGREQCLQRGGGPA